MSPLPPTDGWTSVARLRRQFARRRREGRGGQLFTPYPPTIYTPIFYDYFRPPFISNPGPRKYTVPTLTIHLDGLQWANTFPKPSSRTCSVGSNVNCRGLCAQIVFPHKQWNILSNMIEEGKH